jgi:tetraprenyl-beta-curcumene synthase
VDFQALNLSERQGGHEGLRSWASEATPTGCGLAWWETAAAAGSSLAVHALIAAAANSDLELRDVHEIDGAYFPVIGALHSLLDSLVDRREDLQKEQRSLLDYYRSSADAAIRLEDLARRARLATEGLPRRHVNEVILMGMCSYYLSSPECDTVEAQTIARALTRALALPLRVATLMFRVRRLVHTLTRRTYI